MGNRVEFKKANNDTWSFVYDVTAGMPAVVKEAPGEGSRVKVPGIAGSTGFLTDENGVLTDKYSCDAWGKAVHSGSTEQPYQYVGRYGYYAHVQDSTMGGLLQLGVRFYDPGLGRFTQVDPIRDGLNWYAYVEGNSVALVDPWGLGPRLPDLLGDADTHCTPIDTSPWCPPCRALAFDKGVRSAAVEQGAGVSRVTISIDWSSVSNPFLDTEPAYSPRDPLLVYQGGIFRCFYTVVERGGEVPLLYLESATSTDLAHWSHFTRLTDSPIGFSSPGSITRVGDEWVMSVQSYPIEPGRMFAGESARLWLMRSLDLVSWSAPTPMHPQGAQVAWTESHRQIDPCIVEHDGRLYCLYKTGGCLGLLVSPDLANWEEASPESPVFGRDDTPDGSSCENPCVVNNNGELVLFFSPCRRGRGIGVARSEDLVHWRDAHYLDFPELPWAGNGPTAAMVCDLRATCGRWVMVFHGDRQGIDPHSAALGIAWSDDLEHWEVP